MGRILLGLAAGLAALAIASPAYADGNGIVAANGSGFGGGFGGGNGGGFGGGHFHHGNGQIGTWINGGEWALYNNRTFQSDSFNGWWHDRPDRAYPAWMRNNQNCQRQWYAGSTLTC